jgi:G3E family GTPase
MSNFAGKLIPVTILTGFLGSGKTTLVNNILSQKHGIKFAVIENEFGEVGVDDALIGNRLFGSEEEIIEMMNGCICCTVRADLVEVLKRLLLKEKRKFDAILIETTGLADPAPVAQTFFVDEAIRELCYLDAIITVVDAKHVSLQLDRKEDPNVENECMEQIAFADVILLNKIDLLNDNVEELEKVKGRINSINSSAQIIQTTQSRVDIKSIWNLKGFSLDRILAFDPNFLQEEGIEHEHDPSVSSLSLVIDDPININSLSAWISVLLQTEGNNLFRYKGIIHAKGMEEKYVFQGIHMLFRGDFMGKWNEEQRQSRFVFIGKNLDKDFLRKGFLLCVAQPLRFPVGTVVLARTGDTEYEPGTVLKQWDEGNPYRIQLESGDEVWAPDDSDDYVKLKENIITPSGDTNSFN